MVGGGGVVPAQQKNGIGRLVAGAVVKDILQYLCDGILQIKAFLPGCGAGADDPAAIPEGDAVDLMDDEISTCVALLHDTVEDTELTLEALAKEFPKEVVEAVALMTHGEGVDYFDYVRAIKKNPIAVKVKLADLAHNSDPTRVSQQGSAEKRRAKYAAARKILTEE